MPKNAFSATQALRAQTILSAVCDVYKIELDALYGTEFCEPLITARNVAMYLLCHQEKLPRSISAALIHRDRRAAGYAFYRIGTLRNSNSELEEHIRQIQAFTAKAKQ